MEYPSVIDYLIHPHPSPSFPKTGWDFEKGSDTGYGFILNSLVLLGQGDKSYIRLLDRNFFPALNVFAPEVYDRRTLIPISMSNYRTGYLPKWRFHGLWNEL